MEGQFHAHYAFYSAMQGNHEAIPEFDLDGGGHATSFANGVGQVLGADSEPDSLFFVESWTLGVPAAVENLQRRKADRERQIERERQSRAFRELDNVGSRFFVEQHAWFAEQFPAAPTAAVEEPREAAWAAEGITSRSEYRASQEFAYEYESSPCATDPMTQHRACQLLGVTASSSRERIKAAYRRMVSQWHPDRHARGTEEARRAANEKMAAINEAYRVLRSELTHEAA